MKISACIITLNEEPNLPRCLPASRRWSMKFSSSTRAAPTARSTSPANLARAWCIKTGSATLARKTSPSNRRLINGVFSIDADEEVSSKLAAEIARVKADPASESSDAPNGYEMARIVFYRGRWIKHGDWYPDHLVRLFRRDDARFVGGRVHERLKLHGEHPLLKGHLHHFTYSDATDRAARCAKYAALWAESAYERGRKVRFWSAPVHAFARLIKGFIFKGGWMDGAIGWDIAMGNAREVWLKYYLLRELNESESAQK